MTKGGLAFTSPGVGGTANSSHPERNALAYALDPRATVQRLDYVFLRPARDAGLLRCRGLEVIFDKALAKPASSHGTAAWVSDHYGLSATFE